MARKPLEVSTRPESREIAIEATIPRTVPRRASTGVIAYQQPMEMRYHGAEVNAQMRSGVSFAPFMSARASW